MIYFVGVYIGIAILVSLRLPPTVNLHGEKIEEITADTRVIVGLLWPLYYLVKWIVRP